MKNIKSYLYGAIAGTVVVIAVLLLSGEEYNFWVLFAGWMGGITYKLVQER